MGQILEHEFDPYSKRVNPNPKFFGSDLDQVLVFNNFFKNLDYLRQPLVSFHIFDFSLLPWIISKKRFNSEIFGSGFSGKKNSKINEKMLTFMCIIYLMIIKSITKAIDKNTLKHFLCPLSPILSPFFSSPHFFPSLASQMNEGRGGKLSVTVRISGGWYPPETSDAITREFVAGNCATEFPVDYLSLIYRWIIRRNCAVKVSFADAISAGNYRQSYRRIVHRLT
ncbi:hypothetical protein IEQ34_006062 [Dendrobium chrysotoxum]|uniref:Uncharacterized protein n=1 Tax=Dendrobium chrysotoxum TaxID=161865 RepID=A0AAV7GWS4_DENCH|nr:hypothetical protein IEQ34_006062 [Dendrobium chrysotoxum]